MSTARPNIYILALMLSFFSLEASADGFAKRTFKNWQTALIQQLEHSFSGSSQLFFLVSVGEICGNGIDDDGDGLIDCDDPDCTDPPAAAPCAGVCVGSNLGFESGLTSWITDGNPSTTADAHSGSLAALLDANGEQIEQTIPITISEDSTYYLSFWAKETGNTGWAAAGVKFYDASSNWINNAHFRVEGTPTWTRFVKMFTVPPNTASIVLEFENWATSKSFYVDDVCLKTGPNILSPVPGNGCQLKSSFDGPGASFWLDKGAGWLSYDVFSDTRLTHNGDGTITVQGNMVNGGYEDVSPCPDMEGWTIDITLSNKKTWAQWGGNYDDYGSVNNGCTDYHTDWEYWDIAGTISGTGCNAGQTYPIIDNAAGYQIQVGIGANRNNCGFGMAGWVEYDDGGTTKRFDIYFVLDEACYNPPVVEICGNGIDTDGDGIKDNCDDDDDNDGILDTVEGRCSGTEALPDLSTLLNSGSTLLGDGVTTVTASVSGVGNSTPTWSTSPPRIDIGDDDADIYDPTNEFNNYIVFRLEFSEPVHLTGVFDLIDVDWSQRGSVFGSLGGTLLPTTLTAINNTSVDTGTLGNQPPGITSSGTFPIVLSNPNGTNESTDATTTIDLTLDNLYFIWNIATNYSSTSHVLISFSSAVNLCAEPDYDNDGIPNYLDPDSDNDGCPDAIEGGASFTSSDIDVNDRLTAAVGTDGVPAIAGAPQGLGDSQNENAQAAACTSTEICDNGIDDDGDNLIDYADPDCCTVGNINFETDSDGNTLNPSDDPSEKWAALGVHFSSDDPANNALSIFDSANPPSSELDTGTPNTDFGGNGVGAGGGSGMLGENSMSLNNMLIISGSSNPNQDVYYAGGMVTVDFDMATYVAAIELVDIGYNEVNGRIRAYDGGGTLLSEDIVYGYGENSYQKIPIQVGNVRKLEIDIPHSFGLGSLLFCDDDLPSASIGDLVWNDVDVNGSSAGESGIANVDVTLFDNSNNKIAETITDINGAYIFENLVAGQYQVEIVAPNGYSATHDLNGGNDNDSGVFTLADSEIKTDVDFGIANGVTPPPSIGDCEGVAYNAEGNVRNGSASNATGQPDGVTTEVGNVSDYLIITFDEELPIGADYIIHISGRGGSATSDIFEAPDGTTLPSSQADNPTGFTFNGQATGAENVITQVTKTTSVPTKYIYFDRGSGDIEIDAVTYDRTCTEICGNGIDDDGDGLIDCADPDCATPLNLSMCQEPDIASFFIGTAYDANTNQFTASGYALTLDSIGPGSAANITNGTFDISATIDNFGNLISGTVTLSGEVNGHTGTLVTGNITAYTSNCNMSTLFEFLFTITGGAVADDYGGTGNSVGVILSQVNNFDGDWSASWNGGTSAVADTAPENCPVGGQVRDDTDLDGDMADPDVGISGVTVSLFDDPGCTGMPGALLFSKTTDANGNYYFSNIPTGCYVIVETDLPLYTSTNDVDLINDNSIATSQPGLNKYPSLGNDFLDAMATEICGNGIDDDGDGLIDCADPECYLAANSGGIDSDGDGIVNSCDMDDDNDGIRDSDECQAMITLDFLGGTCRLNGTVITSLTALGTNDNLTFSNIATLSDGTVVDGRITINNIGSGLNYNPSLAHFELTPYNSTIDDFMMFTLELFHPGSSDIISFSGQMLFRDIDSQGNIDFTELLGIKQNHTVSLGASLQPSSYQNGGGPQNHVIYGVNPATTGVATDWNDEVNSLTTDPAYWITVDYQTVSQLEISYGVTGTAGNIGGARDLYISGSFNILDICDLDGDGIANQLDLDTDGDGCPDAIEGSANFTAADMVTSGMAGGNSGSSYTGSSSEPIVANLGNAVETNPSSAALGVPIIAGNGQGAGDSQNGAAQPAECNATEICGNGIDDDGDGLVDNNDPDCSMGNCVDTPGQNDIFGNVYLDQNSNQVLEPGETGEAGITVNLYEDIDKDGQYSTGDMLVQSEVTNSNGEYSFTVNPTFLNSYNEGVKNGCGDARHDKVNEDKLIIGKDKDIGLRFEDISIPAGVTITDAYVYFTSKKDLSKSGSVDIFGENVPSPEDYCDNKKVNTRVRTTASVNWAFSNWVSDVEYQSVDIKSVIQELIDSQGAYDNGRISLILISNGSDNLEAKSYETNDDGTDAPRLVINFQGNTNYVAVIDESSLPSNTELVTAAERSVLFSTSGLAACNNDFGYNAPEICDNGIDDNGNGLIDCDDPSCQQGLNISAFNDATVCGTTVNISATASGGSSPYNYSWDNGLGSAPSQNVSPSVSTTYTVIVTDANGCTASDQVTITVDCSDPCAINNGGPYLNGLVNPAEVIPAGSYIIDMGVQPQTIDNALKPYGLVWELLDAEQVPVKWAINSNKAKDAPDFNYNGTDYYGGPFIILAEYRTAAVDAIIANWELQGVVGVTTSSGFTAPIARTINYSMNWTLDQKNGGIAEDYLLTAGIPTHAYNWILPEDLDCCSDVFVMPHAEPEWDTHSNLLDWNSCIGEGGCGGAIWAGCKAVSELENIFNPADPDQRMNFLMLDPISPVENPAVWSGDHDGGSMSYSYGYHDHPIMQFMGSMNGAQESGAEQIYLPTNGWRPSTLIGVEDIAHTDVPSLSPGPAAKLAFGYAFGNPNRGFVTYEAGHDVAKSSNQENIAAQRAFLNFSFMAVYDKAIKPITVVPTIMESNQSYALSASATGGAGVYNFSWTSDCGGTITNGNTANATFVAPTVSVSTTCLIRLTVTDNCGTRTAFNTIEIQVNPPTHEDCTNGIDDDGDGLIDCDDPDCNSIFLTEVNVGNCIDHPLMDVATLIVEVGWANAPANDTIEVSIYGKTEYIDVAGGAISPQTLTFVIPADGSVGNALSASWRVNSSLCSADTTFDAPVACSNDQINCDILYLCGNDKPYDGDAWDHGWIEYLDAVNGSANITPVLTKDDGTGLGMYDPMNPSVPVSINFADYGLVIVSATTEHHISTDLVNAIKDLPAALINSNWGLGQALGMSNYGAGTSWGGSAYVDNSNSKELYNFNNDISPFSGRLFTTIVPLANGDAYLWANAGDQAANNNGIFVVYEDTDALPGIAAGHGRRVYFGYHMNGFYANNENGGVLPADVEGWLDPAKHLTLDGKSFFDQALLEASITCNTEICGNGLDDDGDGLIDCADDQCDVPAFSSVSATSPNNCPTLDNGQITIDPVAGVEYSIDVGASFQFSNVFTGLSAGTYNVRIRSLNSGCFTNYPGNPVNIFDPICAEICDNGIDDDGDGLIDCADPDCGPAVGLPNGYNICTGSSVSITAVGSDGGAPYTYQWATLGTGDTHVVSPTATTTYFVTLTDANGCTAENQIEVTVTNCAEICGDGVDNDGNGLTDCDDPACLAVGQPRPEPDSYATCPVTELWEQVTFNDGNLQDPVYSIFQYPSIGSLNMQSSGVFQYTSFSNSCGQDQFIYQVCNQVTGCCDTASVYIEIGDSDAPVLQNIPADITISCDDAVPEIPVFVYGVDACPGIFISFNEESAQPSGGSCQSYEIYRTWTATDRCGNSASSTQVITVADTEAPELFRVYTLSNGAKVMAGVTKRASEQWKYVEFPVNFDTIPIVFSQVVTTGEATAVNVRQRHGSAEGFELKLQEEENQDGMHQAEEVAWVAIESGNLADASLLQVGIFQDLNNTSSGINFDNSYSSTPSFVASVQTYADGDPIGVRFSNLSPSATNVFLEEETTADTEVTHPNENLGFLAMQPGELLDGDGTFVGEASTTILNENWKTISLSRLYTKPVVVFGGLASGGDPATVRVRNVTTNSFEVRIEEWENYDGISGNTVASYLVVEGSIPGMPAYYCDEDAASLQPGFNLFATDNCDAQVLFEYNETSEFTPAGLKVHRTWVIVDDCGNTNNLGRTDTCTMVALRLRTFLYGAMIGNGQVDNLMRDDLRENGLVPLEEPYSDLEAFQHVAEGGGETTTQEMLSITGNDAVVDWVFVEIRDGANSGQIVSTCSALLQRDGDVVGADGTPILYFPALKEGNYYVSIRHRNHLGLITRATEHLNVANAPTIDFGLMSTDVNGDFAAGRQTNSNGRACWAGDLNSDGRVIFQGPNNDVFALFSTVLAAEENEDYLANFIKAGYLMSDLNMDGKSIYQGPNNDRAMILYHSILLHPLNTTNLANFIVSGKLP